mgnify:CR=1 FL=1
MKLNLKDKILFGLFLLGLIYILSPGPIGISDFTPIPNSLKSDEPGDTVQVPNISAYFSNLDRAGITKFYKDDYRKKFIFGWIPPETLNYSPINALQYIRERQEESTFLEEYVYPLRGSIFVNGYEPSVDKEIKKFTKPVSGGPMEVHGQYFTSKTTLRFYPAPWHVSLISYIGIWVMSLSLFKISKEAFKE